MGNMMRRGRVNPTCRCCNISDDPGWRTREKNDWKKEVEEETRPDECCGVCPPILGGGYDCTCKDNPRCTKNKGKK